MKKRAGFVSNSSSSSFIIYGKSNADEDFVTVKLRKKAIFSNSIHTIEELEKHYLALYGVRDQTIKEVLEDEDLTEEYEKYSEIIKEGQTIFTAEPNNSEAEMFETLLDGSDLNYDREY